MEPLKQWYLLIDVSKLTGGIRNRRCTPRGDTDSLVIKSLVIKSLVIKSLVIKSLVIKSLVMSRLVMGRLVISATATCVC
ncbi:hypothetical protein OAG82_03190 [Rubripirellula sp.]|nr:hypothetical protein [Rubripirellula sp.]MDB4621844.1 hypothetical protein [Rubripirellula sp.]